MSKMRQSSRREFVLAAIALWRSASLRAQEHHHHSASAPPAAPYGFAFLNRDQRRTLSILMDRFVPADDRSPGAVGAKVDEYIDFVLLHGDAAVRAIWASGLKRYGEAIATKDAAGVDRFLEQQALHEFSPATTDEAFFVILKTAITEGFYTSETGIVQELGYQGTTYLPDFEGCTHASHPAPEGWVPALRPPKES